MKGAFIVSSEANLYSQIERTLVGHGGRATEGHVVQVLDESGLLFTVFGDLSPGFEADLNAGAAETRGDGSAPSMLTASNSCWGECRSEEVFVAWVRVIARARAEPTWVLDGDGVLWPSTALDPDGVCL